VTKRGRRTPLHAAHVAQGAKMVDFAGWEMPLHYGSQIGEHHAVRRGAGMFDVSHMGVVELHGARSRDLLRYLLANDVARADRPGRAIYSCMLNEQGGVIDDLIVYHLEPVRFRLVINAATRERDLAWIARYADSFGVTVETRSDLAVIAVQGPAARQRVLAVLGGRAAAAGELERFHAAEMDTHLLLARTGYTGEDGFEVMLPGEEAEAFWLALAEAEVTPCGLGARDTLRLEAGLNLNGQDMDEENTPLESGLAWTVAWEPAEREFIGRPALEAQRAAGVQRRLVGLVLEGRGVLRPHLPVRLADGGRGETTSGSYSPTLGSSIALARVPVGDADRCEVEVRGRALAARIVKPPFVRKGVSCV